MSFNFGAFAGGAAKGADNGMQLARESQQYQAQQAQNDNNKAALAQTQAVALPGQADTSQGPTQYAAADPNATAAGMPATVAPGQLDPTAQRQGVYNPQFPTQTQQGYQQQLQNIAMQHATPQQLSEMTAQMGQGNDAQARAGGQLLNNQQTSSALQAVSQIQQGHQQLQTQVAAGDVAGGAKTLLNQLDAAGVQYTVKGNTLTEPGGQTFDLTDPHQIMSAGGAYMSGAVGQALQTNAPIAGAPAREQGAMTDYYGSRSANTQAQAGQNNAAAQQQTLIMSKAQANPNYFGSPEYQSDMQQLSVYGTHGAQNASAQVVGAAKNATAIQVGAGHDTAKVTVGAGNNAAARANNTDTNATRVATNAVTNDTRKTTNAATNATRVATNAATNTQSGSNAAVRAGATTNAALINNGKPAVAATPAPALNPSITKTPDGIPTLTKGNVTGYQKADGSWTTDVNQARASRKATPPPVPANPNAPGAGAIASLPTR